MEGLSSDKMSVFTTDPFEMEPINREFPTKRAKRTAVTRVRRFAVPRAENILLEGLAPIPNPPPSLRCSKMLPIIANVMTTWINSKMVIYHL